LRKRGCWPNYFCSSNQIETYPASLAQQRLWFLDQLETKSAAYNVHLGLWLRGPLDRPALRSSLQEIMNRHDCLRTAFRLEGSELVQVVTHELSLNLPVTDVIGTGKSLSGDLSTGENRGRDNLRSSEAPLSGPDSFASRRKTTFSCAPCITSSPIHGHADSGQGVGGRSIPRFQITFRPPFPILRSATADYAEWQRKWFQTAKSSATVDVLENELEERHQSWSYEQRPRPFEQTFEGASQRFQVVKSFRRQGSRCSAASDPFMVLLAAFKILFVPRQRTPDLLVECGCGRNPVETEGLVGFFVNTLVLRDDLFANRPFPDLVAASPRNHFSGVLQCGCTFEKVVEVLQPERNLTQPDLPGDVLE